MGAAFVDKDIMPVNRYRQARHAFSVFVSERRESDLVQDYTSLLAMRQCVWTSCVKDAIGGCEFAFLRDNVVARPREYLQGKRFIDLLEDVQVGHVRMDGRIDHVLGADDTGLDVVDTHTL